MYSYRKPFVSISAVILLICIFSGFCGSDDETELKRLLDLRTEILQQAYYKEISLQEAVQKLGQIETQPILGEDIDTLAVTDATDLDKVQRMEFQELRKGTGLAPYSTYQVKLTWYMRGPQGDYSADETYHVVVKTINQVARLSSMEPAESGQQ